MQGKKQAITLSAISLAFLLAAFAWGSRMPLMEFVTFENIMGYDGYIDTDETRFPSGLEYPKRLRFCIVSYSLPEKLYEKGKIMKRYFEANIPGVEVKMLLLRNYNSLIDLLKVGQVEVVWAAPLIYGKLKNEINYNLLVKLLEQGFERYDGAIVVRRDSGIEKLEDLRGRSMAFVDENSASGFYLQTHMLSEKGMSPVGFFSRFDFVGSHDRALQYVIDKKFDAASVGYQLMKLDAFATGEIRILARTRSVPNAPILVNNHLDPGIRSKLYGLLRYPEKHSGGAEFMKGLCNFDNVTGFADADTSEYEF